MTNEEVIAYLIKENLELKNTNKKLYKFLKKICNMIYCIGGPLNDNKLKYSNEQLVIFSEIAEQAEFLLPSKCDCHD